MKRLDGFMKGVNFGGWLSQGEYTKEHLDSFITADDFRKAASWGIDHIRVPVDYNIFGEDGGTPSEEGLAYVQKAIDLCGENGLNMVLDLHKTYGYSFYDGYNEAGFFDSEELQEKFCRLWECFAQRFGKYSDRLAFELLNEVTEQSYSKKWNAIAAKTIGIIRKYSPDIKIFIGSYWNNSVDALCDLDAPADENIVYNFHCYDPFIFTHQAAYWVPEMRPDFRISYPGNRKEYSEKLVELGLTRVQDLTDVPENGFDSKYFEERFEKAVRLCEERGAALYCGEYGVIDQASAEDALGWFKDINAAFEKFGIGRSVWNFKEKDFGLCDDHLAPVLPELVKYL